MSNINETEERIKELYASAVIDIEIIFFTPPVIILNGDFPEFDREAQLELVGGHAFIILTADREIVTIPLCPRNINFAVLYFGLAARMFLVMTNTGGCTVTLKRKEVKKLERFLEETNKRFLQEDLPYSDYCYYCRQERNLLTHFFIRGDKK
jgi:hypothetical protein